MAEMMICPNAGECGREHLRQATQNAGHHRCVPHKKEYLCGETNRLHGWHEDEPCPPCVPYVREFKVGDRVEVLGVHEADSFSNNTVKGKIGTVGHDFTPQAQVEHGYFRGDIMLDGEDTNSYFYAVSIELIQGETVKYRVKGNITIDLLYRENKNECRNFYKHLAELMYHLKPKQIRSHLDQGELLGWVQRDSERLSWALEKGYIEKVASEYDRWENEWHSLVPDGTCRAFVDWAKRMPK